MGSPNNTSSSILPKISKKLAYRTLGLAIFVGGLGYGLVWFLQHRGDLGGLKTSESAGWIAAIQYLPDGQQAVLIAPDKTIHRDKGYQPRAIDRDIVWSPKGNFVYFVSNRKDNNYNLFRLSPSSDDPAEQRTTGTRARGNPTFPAQPNDEPDSTAKALVTCGGVVQEFDPTNQSTEQVLPPTTKEINVQKGDDKGIESQFSGAYGNIGTSFRLARWCGNGHYIVGVMRRETGEVLVLQEMRLIQGKFPDPRAITSGEHVDFDVNPVDGTVIYAVQHFQWPDTPPLDDKGNPVKKPFINGVVQFDPETGKAGLISKDDKVSFGSPTIKPDGKAFAILIGDVKDGSFAAQGLMTFPTSKQPDFKPIRIPGDVHEPSWSPDGKSLVFALRNKDGKRTIYDYVEGESSPRDITGGEGDFGSPKFSPQIKSGP